jgi:hypothetical protein
MRKVLLASVAAVALASTQAHARPLNAFIASQNLGAGAVVEVGNGAHSIDGQGIINFTTGPLPLSGDPVSSSGFAYAVIEIIPQYFYSSATNIPACFAQVVNFNGNDPFSTTHPTVENSAFVAGDGSWHVQFYLRPLASEHSYIFNFMCPPKD